MLKELTLNSTVYLVTGYSDLRKGIEGSMSAPGCPYDNSCEEIFFASLKKELTFRRKHATIEDVKTDLYRYVELFYNRKLSARLQAVSTLGYMSPVAYRLANSQ